MYTYIQIHVCMYICIYVYIYIYVVNCIYPQVCYVMVAFFYRAPHSADSTSLKSFNMRASLGHGPLRCHQTWMAGSHGP